MTKEVARYVYDSAAYRAEWPVRISMWLMTVGLPLAGVAFIIIALTFA